MMYVGLPDQYWGEAVWQAAYIHKIIVSPVTGMKSSHEILFRKAPNNSMIKVFRRTASVYKYAAQQSNKLDSRAENGLYMRLRGGVYGVFMSRKTVIIESRHVHFGETVFPS